jgi:hypothetical protein
MALVTPFWFKQRQGKAEEAGPNLYKITGPNMKEAFLGIRQGDNGRWHAFVRHQADGPDVAATTESRTTPYEAWEVAFEMYRTLEIV